MEYNVNGLDVVKPNIPCTSIWEGITYAVRISDANGKIIRVNEQFCELFKKSESELINHPITELYNNLEADFLSNYKENYSKNTFPRRCEVKSTLWNDRHVWLSLSYSFIKNDSNNLLMALIRDITEQKKSELISEAIYEINNAVLKISCMERSKNDLSLLLSMIYKVLIKIADAENFFIGLYQQGEDEILVPYSIDKFDTYDRVELKDTFSGYVIKTNQSILVNAEKAMEMVKQGLVKILGTPSRIWLGVPIRVRNKIWGIIVMQDYENEAAFGEEELYLLEFISDQIGIAMDRILTRNELLESEHKLRIANTTKDKFFSIIAHDLKNPFITLKGFSEILYNDYDDLAQEEVKEYLKCLFDTTEVTCELLNNLLTWSRSQLGRIEINFEELNLKTLVDKTLLPLKQTLLNKRISLIININEKIKIFSDHYMFETIIRNIVGNAIKFTKRYGSITITAIEKDDKTEILIKDSGIGMTKKTVGQLFKIDQHISKPGTNKESGTGLGLIICKEFIEKLKATITVESELGLGSEFTISFNKHIT